jgi:hypothetical protein
MVPIIGSRFEHEGSEFSRRERYISDVISIHNIGRPHQAVFVDEFQDETALHDSAANITDIGNHILNPKRLPIHIGFRERLPQDDLRSMGRNKFLVGNLDRFPRQSRLAIWSR